MPLGKYRRTTAHRAAAALRATKHGGVGTPEHRAWSSMVQRCTNPNVRSFPRYGGRGIKVCSPWLRFENFLADMGPRHSLKHTLDRINNDGDYEPSNCRWTTMAEQTRNRSSNRLVTYNGITLPFTAWAHEVGLKPATLKRRIDKLGWSLQRALETPCRY